MSTTEPLFTRLRDRARTHFNQRAARYDNPLTAFIGKQELRVIRQYVPPTREVLDYGCGTGRTTLDLLARGCLVTAYDLSPNMLSIAAQRAKRRGFTAEFTSDETQLLHRNWPIVVCIGVLDYYPDPLPLLQQLRRFLTPSGRLVVTYPNALSLLGWLYALSSHWTLPATPRSPAFIRGQAHRAGFQVERLSYAFPVIPLLGMTIVLEMGPTQTVFCDAPPGSR